MSNIAFNEDAPNSTGLTLPPFNAEIARAVLEWLRQGFPQEQETFERLTQSLDETQASAADSLSIVPEELNSNGTNKHASSFLLPPDYPEGAITFLRELREGEAEEQRETFEYLKKALNEERAAAGERLLFADDNE